MRVFRCVDNLQSQVAHACNRSCDASSHYSNRRHIGIMTLQDAADWTSRWSGRLNTRRSVLLSGEPTVHPDLPDFIPPVRRHRPGARIRIVTNGFFLHRHPTRAQLLHVDRDTDLSPSAPARRRPLTLDVPLRAPGGAAAAGVAAHS